MLALEDGLFNACLQNAQQAVEKALKALCVAKDIPLRKTHSIDELHGLLMQSGIAICLCEEERDLLDSIYLPSKYPLGSVLPVFEPDEALGQRCMEIARRIVDFVDRALCHTPQAK